MSAGLEGIAGVLGEHIWEVIDDTGIEGRLYRADCDFLAAAVVAWVTDRLASDEVREAVIRAIYGDGLDGAPEIATAALTAVTEALWGPS